MPDGVHVFRQIHLRSPIQNEKFQIDLLLVTPFFLLVGEVKHIAGYLQFDTERGQLLRTWNGETNTFSCPLRQSERQAFHLRKWVEKRMQVSLPVLYHVLVSQDQAQIDAPKTESGIYHAVNLPSRVRKLMIEHSKRYISKEQLRKLCSDIEHANRETGADLLHRFQLDRREVMGPIPCPSCGKEPLRRRKLSWGCFSCRYRSRTSHLQALHDIGLLIQEPLRRKDFELLFLGASDRSILRLLNPWTKREGYYYHIVREKTSAALGSLSSAL
ncbi:nuclease-related domain-containing protein [Alkalicoccus chagannorensis]